MKRSALLSALFAVALPVSAERYGTGSVTIEGAWARELPPVSVNGAAYLTIANEGVRPDRLTGASSAVAGRVEIHVHEQSGGMMAMRRLDGLDLPPGERVRFAPGGLHLMLIGLEEPLEKGGRFTVRLTFASAPPIEIEVPVMAMDAVPAQSRDHSHDHSHDGSQASESFAGSSSSGASPLRARRRAWSEAFPVVDAVPAQSHDHIHERRIARGLTFLRTLLAPRPPPLPVRSIPRP